MKVFNKQLHEVYSLENGDSRDLIEEHIKAMVADGWRWESTTFTPMPVLEITQVALDFYKLGE